MKKIICLILPILCLLGMMSDNDLHASFSEPDEHQAFERTQQVRNARQGYLAYLEHFQGMNLARPSAGIELRGIDFSRFEGDAPQVDSNQSSVITGEQGLVAWQINNMPGLMLQPGLYNVIIEYFPTAGRSSPIERAFLIDGQAPFTEANNLVFQRVWGNINDEFQVDALGNDRRPSQVERPEWRTSALRDDLGYIAEPYMFFFDGTMQEIAFRSLREPMEIRRILIQPYEVLISYAEYREQHVGRESLSANEFIRIEGQHATLRSSPTLFPITDRSSPITYPNSTRVARLNAIGGNNWRIPGDWITWEFTVNQPGFYNLAVRARQNEVRGMFSSRRILINGEQLFSEMNNFRFRHSSRWQNVTFGTENYNHRIWLEPGVHTITLEVTFGDFGLLIRQLEDTINDLNGIYRDVIRVTGTRPDPFRDYFLGGRNIPDLEERLRAAQASLDFISQQFEAHSGERSAITATADSMSRQLGIFIDRPSQIPARLRAFNDNIASLGTILLLARELPLTIDYIALFGDDVSLPRANANIFRNMWFSVARFFTSFFTDFNAIGGMPGQVEGDREINVWIQSGRDQANVLRQLIDEDFTPNTGITVNMQLVNAGVLLPATLSGRGPDVALGVDGFTVNDFALRNAVQDLSGFPGFAEHQTLFEPSAWTPFELHNNVYAVPETQNFLMLFVREDIFEDHGWPIPTTWMEVIELVPRLDRLSLQFFLPVNTVGDSSLNATFSSLLFQNGGQFYITEPDGSVRSGLDSHRAITAFEQWTNFYTSFSFPLAVDFVQRFRTGQMPIGVSFYTTFNVLSVFAPELRGKWGFHPIPGTPVVDDNGNPVLDNNGQQVINNTSHAVNSGAMMLRTARDQDACWEFLQWWSSTQTQVRYGREMEAVIGSAARWHTANIYAMEQLPWTVRELEALRSQQRNTQAKQNTPGGYMTQRALENAFRHIINDRWNERETLLEFVNVINMEINRKRREFGLPIFGMQ
ncbi:MAG: extracellular solute-binding protein [Erysipelotrichales bacterium]|nr:extracellular solute-binding protein [Erysipelotrichales bacterium]